MEQLGYIKSESIIKETSSDEISENRTLIELAYNDWISLSGARARRRRARKFVRGQQWSDLVQDKDGNLVTEEQLISSQGRNPLIQNMMRQIMRNIIGQFRANKGSSVAVARDRDEQELGEMMSNAVRYALDVNEAEELDARNLEEFLLSGIAIFKTQFREWTDRNTEDVWLEMVNPNRCFYNSDLTDPRGHDIKRIGELIDLDIEDLVAAFAMTEEDENAIRKIYASQSSAYKPVSRGLTAANIDNLNFFIAPNGKCRIIEIWYQKAEWRIYAHDYANGTYLYYPNTKETKQMLDSINLSRLEKVEQAGEETEPLFIEYSVKKDIYWHVKYLTPTGETLYSSESPFAHKSHPYNVLLYPLIDGEVWGLMEDFIDQQKYINRLVSMLDFIISASAKGVLMVPESSIPAGQSIEDFSEAWRSVNGVIVYKPNMRGEIPQQVASNSTNIGIHELLSLEMRLMQETSGVSGAIQGLAAKSGTPSSLYMQMAQNSMLSLRDIFDSYINLLRKRDLKVLQTIQQFYKESRYIGIAGGNYSGLAQYIDPDKIKDVQFDVVMSQTNNSPTFRQLIDDKLEQFVLGGMMPIELYLEHSSFPGAGSLLKKLREYKEQMSAEQAAASGDPRAVEMMQKAIMG